jgi:hypothetical protein
MVDDKTKRRPQDSTRVSLSEDWEVDYWTERFGVSRDRLRQAVQEVGNDAEAVGRYLAR